MPAVTGSLQWDTHRAQVKDHLSNEDIKWLIEVHSWFEKKRETRMIVVQMQ